MLRSEFRTGKRGQGAGSILRTADFEVAVRQAEQGRGPAAGFCCVSVLFKIYVMEPLVLSERMIQHKNPFILSFGFQVHLGW